jgi:hypothetical protein
MATQLHFVVMYDEDKDEFFMDYESQEVKFKNAPIFNTETDEWEQLTEEHFDSDSTIYNRAGDALAHAVMHMKAFPLKEDKNVT